MTQQDQDTVLVAVGHVKHNKKWSLSLWNFHYNYRQGLRPEHLKNSKIVLNLSTNEMIKENDKILVSDGDKNFSS